MHSSSRVVRHGADWVQAWEVTIYKKETVHKLIIQCALSKMLASLRRTGSSLVLWRYWTWHKRPFKDRNFSFMFKKVAPISFALLILLQNNKIFSKGVFWIVNPDICDNVYSFKDHERQFRWSLPATLWGGGNENTVGNHEMSPQSNILYCCIGCDLLGALWDAL